MDLPRSVRKDGGALSIHHGQPNSGYHFRCPRGNGRSLFLATCVILVLSILGSATLVGCGGPSTEELRAVDYSPLVAGDWQVSTPEEQGLDPMLVAELYHNAEQLRPIASQLEHLPALLQREGVDPRIPWLYGLKLDFRLR